MGRLTLRRMAAAVVAVVLAVAGTHAAEPLKPAIEIRVQSVNQILQYAGFVGEIADQAETFEQYANAAKAFAGKNGIEGFDIKKPIGLYAEISKDIHDSPAILLVPVANEKMALNALKNYAKLEMKEIKDGVFETYLPKVPLPVFVRFADGYLQATIGSKDNFDRAIAPKTFFGESQPNLAEIHLHVERVPADVRKVLLGQVEFQLQKEKDNVMKNERSAGKKAIAGFILDGAATTLKTLLDDAKTVSLIANVQPKDDQVKVDLKVSPKSGSPLAGMIANAAKKPTTTFGRANADNPIMRLGINVAMTDAQKKKFEPVVDQLLNEAEQGVDPFVADLVKRFFSSIEPTLKAADLDFTAVLNGPETEGKYRLNLMVKMVKGLDLVDTLVEASKIIPAGIIEPKFDLEKINGHKVHSMTIHENPGKLEDLFGSPTIWLGTSNELLTMGMESDGKLLKGALGQKSTSVGIVDFSVAVGRMAVLVAEDDKKREALKGEIKKIGIADSQSDRIALNVTGGSDLTITATAKGKALKVFVAIDRVNKQ